jgi:N utilization substance protein B
VENREIIRRRQRARKILVQALYQWHMNASEIAEVQAQFITENNPDKFDQDYFCNTLKGITEHLEQLDQEIFPFLDRPVNMLNPVEYAVMRLGTYEFLFCPEIPFKVIIDEAVALCKTYGAVEGHRYVNGVLHHLAKKIRSIETSRG